MAIVVDIYGTITETSGTDGSTVVVSNIPLHGQSIIWDSDSEVWYAATPASELGLLTDVQLDSEGVSLVKPGSTLVYDSDLQKWRPGQGSAVADVEDLKNVTLYEKDSEENPLAYTKEHYATLVWDSEINKWVSKKLPLTELGLVKTTELVNLRHQDVVYWDSDQAQFVIDEIPLTSTTSLEQLVDVFEATGGQRKFILQERPWGDVTFVRNGIAVPNSAITVDRNNREVSYDSDLNLGSRIDSDDTIQIQYVVSSVTTQTKLPDLADVDPDLANATHGDMFFWDSDTQKWSGGLPRFGSTKVETFSATAGQTLFNLSETAAGDVIFTRNGAVIPNLAAVPSLDGNSVNYVAAQNEGDVIDSDDVITISYINAAFPAWPPKVWSNSPNINHTARRDGSFTYYSDSDGSLKFANMPTLDALSVVAISNGAYKYLLPRYDRKQRTWGTYNMQEMHGVTTQSIIIANDWITSWVLQSNVTTAEGNLAGGYQIGSTNSTVSTPTLGGMEIGGVYEVTLFPNLTTTATSGQVTISVRTYSGSPRTLLDFTVATVGHAYQGNGGPRRFIYQYLAGDTSQGRISWYITANTVSGSGSNSLAGSFMSVRRIA